MKKCSIVGAGIIGQLSALALIDRGISGITIYESDACPPASWAGGGILSPLFPWRYSDALNQLCEMAVPLYQEISQRLQHEGVLSPDALHLSGMWMEVADGERAQARTWLGRTSVHSVAQPRTIVGTVREGLWFPGLGSMRNPWFLKALRAFLTARGVRFIRRPVRGWTEDADGVRLGFKDGGFEPVDRLLLASGAWVGSLLPERASIFPAKGEMLLFRLGDRAPGHIVLSVEGYLIPRKNGDTLVGSTMRMGDDSTWPTVQGRWQLMDLARTLLPDLESQPAFHWAGVRPGNQRDYPYIGSVSGSDRVFVAAGHFRNGLVAAPATARLVAQLICGESQDLDLSTYSLSASSRSSSSFLSR